MEQYNLDGMPLKYHKFLIYVSLPISIILQVNSLVPFFNAAARLNIWGNFILVSGICSVLLTAYLYLCLLLHKPKHYRRFLTFCYIIIANDLILFILSIIGGLREDLIFKMFFSLLGASFALCVMRYYYKKRKALFGISIDAPAEAPAEDPLPEKLSPNCALAIPAPAVVEALKTPKPEAEPGSDVELTPNPAPTLEPPPTLRPAAETAPTLEPPPIVIPAVETAPTPETPPVASHNTKKRFCSKCGGEIEHSTKKCGKCGKQYFNFRRMAFLLAIVALLSAASVSLVVMNVLLNNKYNDVVQECADAKAEVSRLTSRVAKLNNSLTAAINELEVYEKNLYFYIPGTNVCHIYGCSLLKEYKKGTLKIIIYSDAENENYKQCQLCKPFD